MRDTQTQANSRRKLAQNTTENPKRKKKKPANTVARGAMRAGADEKPAGKPSEVAESAREPAEGARAR